MWPLLRGSAAVWVLDRGHGVFAAVGSVVERLFDGHDGPSDCITEHEEDSRKPDGHEGDKRYSAFH